MHLSQSRSVSARCRVLGLALLALACPGLHSQAWAQSYTLKELKAPFALKILQGCRTELGRHLADNGDVAMRCDYLGGVTTYTALGFPAPQPYYYNRVVVWRNGGSPQPLSMPSGQTTATFRGINAQGQVLGLLTPLVKSLDDLPSDVFQPVWWKASSRSNWTAPASLSGRWAPSAMSPSGLVLAFSPQTEASPMRMALIRGTEVQLIPLPPVDISSSGYASGYNGKYFPLTRLNDQGQFLVYASIPSGPPLDNGYQPTMQQGWFWDGAQWRLIDTGTQALGVLLDLSNDGTLLFRSAFTARAMWTWRADTGVKVLDGSQFVGTRSQDIDDEIQPVGGLSNRDTVVGRGLFTGAPSLGAELGQVRAALWRQGQMLDLNTLTTPPKGIVFDRAITINQRGQILVVGKPSNGSAAQRRHWLLTPK